MRSVSYMVLQIKTQSQRREAVVNLRVVAADTSTVSSRLCPVTQTSSECSSPGLPLKEYLKMPVVIRKICPRRMMMTITFSSDRPFLTLKLNQECCRIRAPRFKCEK